MTIHRTRLAPSPTGYLHLGNARTFLINWLMARQAGGQIVLRMEDLDRQRVKPEMAEAALLDLRWLGLDWDEGPVHQSDRLDRYRAAFDRLRELDLAFPCVCTRKEVAAAASAPHAGDEGPTYPGTCRGRFKSASEAENDAGRPPAWRFRVDPAPLPFDDRFLGPTTIDPSDHGGDFVIRSFDGTWSYQLAVTVDDAEMAINEVVRGRDLVPSTPRQILLHRALGSTPPTFTHLPLVLDRDGRRLAKRHGDTELRELRENGVEPGIVLAHVARLSGMETDGDAVTAEELVRHFELQKVPPEDLAPFPLPWQS